MCTFAINMRLECQELIRYNNAITYKNIMQEIKFQFLKTLKVDFFIDVWSYTSFNLVKGVTTYACQDEANLNAIECT